MQADERADRGYDIEDPPLCPGLQSMAHCGPEIGPESAGRFEQQWSPRESPLTT